MVARAKLLQLSNHAIRHVGNTFRQQTIHHALHDIQLVLDGEVDKVGIDNHAEWRTERSVVFEEHAGWDLLLDHCQCLNSLLLLLLTFLDILANAIVLCGQKLCLDGALASFRLLGHCSRRKWSDAIPPQKGEIPANTVSDS